MSDSELSDAPSTSIPPDAQLAQALREEVRRADKAGDDYTVRTVRDAVEKSLSLPAEYFKTHETWKAESSRIIKEESEKQQAGGQAQGQTSTKSKPAESAKAKTAPKRPPKRRSPASNHKPSKKRKVQSGDDESAGSLSLSDGVQSASEEERIQTGAKRGKNAEAKARPSKPVQSDQELGDASSSIRKAPASKPETQDSESEMSVVLDEEPTKKRRSKSRDAVDSKARSKTGRSKSIDETDPDKEEIKKLQGQLARCGVRKVWGKELKPYESSKAKVKHLREMLADVGMTGRFSNEKAAQIKEARELAADIEAVQEGAQRWGKSDDEDGEGESKTRGGRRLVRGAKNYAFLSSDGEETD